MTDNLTKLQRHKTMSLIKSKWTRQEIKAHLILSKNGIKHKMHPKLRGSPDIILLDKKIAIFLNGCFWHKCKKDFVMPKSNRIYWAKKLAQNVKLDRENINTLHRNGWKVHTLWEHDLKSNAESKLKRLGIH